MMTATSLKTGASFEAPDFATLQKLDQSQTGATFSQWMRHIKPDTAEFEVKKEGELIGYYGIFRHIPQIEQPAKSRSKAKPTIPLTNPK